MSPPADTFVGLTLLNAAPPRRGAGLPIGTRFAPLSTARREYEEAPDGCSPMIKTPGESAIGIGDALKTILVVDDEATIRNILVQVLRMQGYRVLSAVNGADALRTILDTPERIDVLITDLAMPVMGGEELIQYAAALRPEMKTICLSAGFSEVSLSLAVLFLPKPFSLQAIIRSVQQALGGANRADTMTG